MGVELPRVEAVFAEALEIAAPAERSAYLDRACGGDPSLRRQVESLLDAHDRAGGFLESPVATPTVMLGPTPRAEGTGAAVGPYRLLEQVGEGGMGTVYMAEQVHPVRRRVALKLIKPGMDSNQVVARFEAERQAVALMDHPNIARVLDAGTTDSGRPYFVMELVRGLPITDYCDREQLTVPERLELFVLVCRAVQHAHQKGVIHRDLKPSNVLVTVVDGVPTPKVIDFGVAKATGGSLTERTLFTGFHQMVGTPLYMSPEQADLSSADVDTRSDIYALGVLLYELLTGSTPFDRETFAKAAFDEMRRMIREDEPPTPSTRLSSLAETITTVSAKRSSDPRRLNRAVRGELDWIAMKALEKDRRRRYETAGDFAADVIRHLTDQPVEACPPSMRYRFAKSARRHRAAMTTAALVAVALLVGVVGSVAMALRAVDAERRTAAALGRVRASLGEADRQRTRARKAVDQMYTQVAARWLSREGGLTPLQREFLEKALAFYEEFARERADDPEAHAEAAAAAARVGEIRAELGQSAGALEAHRRALEAFRRLAARSPDRPTFRREVARSLNAIGRLQEAVGRTRDAEPAYREALALREQLAAAPGSPADRTDLAVGLRDLGAFLQSTHRGTEGEKALLRARELLTRLVAVSPEGPSGLGHLAETEARLGGLYLWSDRSPEAEASYRRCLAIRRKLADADPADPEKQFDLAKAYFAVGDWRRLTHQPRQAVEEFRRALPIAEKLSADHPDRPGYRSVLATTLFLLAEQLGDIDRPDEAEQALNRAREVIEKLAADFPGVPDYRQRVAAVLGELGVIHARRGRDREAWGAFEAAYTIRKALVAAHPDLSTYRHNLAATCYLAAVNCASMDAPAGREVARARELAREAVAIEPETAGFWKGLALAEYRAGDLEAALKAETRSLALRDGRQRGVGYVYDWVLMALIHLERGDREQARLWTASVFSGRSPIRLPTAEDDLNRLVLRNEARLRALLPADAEGLVKLLERGVEVRRAERGAASDLALLALGELAEHLAALGRHDEAGARFEEARRLDPDRWRHPRTAGPWFPLGVLRLRGGDVDGYRALCAEALRRFGGATSGLEAGQLAFLCTGSPAAGVDPGRPLALARRAVASDPDEPAFLLALGAAQYRAARHEAAVATLTRALGLLPQDAPWGRARAGLFLAMARQRLGQVEEARRALAEADRALAAAPAEPDPASSPFAWDWCERALGQVLRREAGEVLGVAPPPGADG